MQRIQPARSRHEYVHSTDEETEAQSNNLGLSGQNTFQLRSGSVRFPEPFKSRDCLSLSPAPSAKPGKWELPSECVVS